MGVPERRLGHDDLVRPHRGVRSARPGRTMRDRCANLLPVLPDGAAFSHVTAARLWGLPLSRREESASLHVVSRSGQHPRRPGVIAHRVNHFVGAIVAGMPVVAPPLAWAQCAEVLELDELVALGDALAGRWSPEAAAREVPLGELERAVEAWGSRRGARRLREALDLVRPDVWSPKETELRLLLVRAGVPEPPGLNASIADAAGNVIGHGDLVWPERRLVVEYEGDHHRTDRWQWRSDVAKYERYSDEGWRVVRATDDDLVTPGILVARITRHLGSETVR
ncbi:MAG: hypothetical protein JWP75_746 [Frondihabitans sp.]|nr:hypothetical protein [Frondihabitans sp.]